MHLNELCRNRLFKALLTLFHKNYRQNTLARLQASMMTLATGCKFLTCNLTCTVRVSNSPSARAETCLSMYMSRTSQWFQRFGTKMPSLTLQISTNALQCFVACSFLQVDLNASESATWIRIAAPVPWVSINDECWQGKEYRPRERCSSSTSYGTSKGNSDILLRHWGKHNTVQHLTRMLSFSLSERAWPWLPAAWSITVMSEGSIFPWKVDRVLIVQYLLYRTVFGIICTGLYNDADEESESYCPDHN